MDIVHIDLREKRQKNDLHRYLRESLPINGYDTDNLDSLFDALTSHRGELHIHVVCDAESVCNGVARVINAACASFANLTCSFEYLPAQSDTV